MDRPVFGGEADGTGESFGPGISGVCGVGMKTVFLTSLRPRLALGLRGVGNCEACYPPVSTQLSPSICQTYRPQCACHTRKRRIWITAFFANRLASNVKLKLRLIWFTEFFLANLQVATSPKCIDSRGCCLLLGPSDFIDC